MADVDEYGNEIEEESEGENESQKPVLDKNIRARLRVADEQAKELAALKESVLYDKAGIPEDGLGTMFRKGYDGEKTVDAIKARATEYGILKTTATLTEATSNDSELEALRVAQGATTGGDGASPDPQQLYLEALANAQTSEEAQLVVDGPLGKRVGVYSTRGTQ